MFLRPVNNRQLGNRLKCKSFLPRKTSSASPWSIKHSWGGDGCTFTILLCISNASINICHCCNVECKFYNFAHFHKVQWINANLLPQKPCTSRWRLNIEELCRGIHNWGSFQQWVTCGFQARHTKCGTSRCINSITERKKSHCTHRNTIFLGISK